MAVSVIAACRSLALSTWLLSFCFVHLLCLDFTVAEKEEWYTAFVNITYRDPATGDAVTEKTECGRYGEHSPKKDARGLVAMAASPHERQACEPGTRFAVPASGGAAWIALVAKGNCTYKEKIRHAATHNASAVVIFNVGSGSANETITMPHQGTGDIVAIMIPESKGREIAALLERNVTVTMHITIGTRNLQKYVSRTSVVFVSISFIVLMIISLAWLVFYYIQRFRYANARDRNQVRAASGAAANEGAPTHQFIAAVQLCIPVTLCSTGEHQPPMSSDSDTSLIMAVEVGLSDVELSSEQEREEVKS